MVQTTGILMDTTPIELQPGHTAIVFDHQGHMIELYMPDYEDEDLVPEKIRQVLELILDDR